MSQWPHLAPFPLSRPRRLRQTPWIRDLVAENHLRVSDLIWPIFIHDKDKPIDPIGSLKGINRVNIATAVEQAKQAHALGIKVMALFPHIDERLRTFDAKSALDPNGLIPQACRAIKSAVPEMGLLVDIALDPYTDHGHDGLLIHDKIDNDATTKVLIEQSLTYVAAGADIVAPSDMMDGRIGAIRRTLEASGYKETLIMSYAAKYASAFYGPYRDAIGVKGLKGDKKTYQMDSANSEEALREVAIDIAEGADMVMVKPGMPYLDIVWRVSETFKVPTFAYQVSGEYAMLRAAIDAGLMDESRVILESLLSFKRAGASGVLTYFALEVAQWLQT